LDNLHRKLLTHKIYFKEDEEEVQTKRHEIFKTTNAKLYSSEDELSEGDEDSMVMITRGLKKIFKSNRFNRNKFYKKGSSSKKNEKSSKCIEISINKNESNLGPCFGCGLPGYAVKDSSILQNKDEKQKHKAIIPKF